MHHLSKAPEEGGLYFTGILWPSYFSLCFSSNPAYILGFGLCAFMRAATCTYIFTVSISVAPAPRGAI
jgi:hypothetical protein